MPYRTLEDLGAQLRALPAGGKLYVPAPVVKRLFPPDISREELILQLDAVAQQYGCATVARAHNSSMPCFAKPPMGGVGPTAGEEEAASGP